MRKLHGISPWSPFESTKIVIAHVIWKLSKQVLNFSWLRDMKLQISLIRTWRKHVNWYAVKKKLTSALQCFLPLFGFCSLVSSQILERILLHFTGESFHSRIQVVFWVLEPSCYLQEWVWKPSDRSVSLQQIRVKLNFKNWLSWSEL